MGVLEISNSYSNQFNFDDEYLAVVMAKFIQVILKRLTNEYKLKA